MTKAAILALRLGCAILIIVSLFRMLKPPSVGSEIAYRKGLPHHAVVAHRGASYLAPENTLAAFRIARDLGADYLECDVQRTKDNVLIVFHDATPERTTDAGAIFPGREENPIGEFTYGELMQLDAGSWFNQKNPDRARDAFEGLKICTLKELIESATGYGWHPGLLIELKNPSLYPGIEKEVIDLLTACGRISETKSSVVNSDVIQSFDALTLSECRKLDQSLRINYLVSMSHGNDALGDRRALSRAIVDAASLDAGIGFPKDLGWPWNIRAVHKKGLIVLVYTIDRNLEFAIFTLFGGDWIVTNRVERALAFYGRRSVGGIEEIMRELNL